MPVPNSKMPQPQDPVVDPEDALLIDGPEPTDAALDLPAAKPTLEQPEHEGEELGDFGETVFDEDGEVPPEELDPPRATDGDS